MTVKTSISLTDQQENFARSLVREGRFSSLSAVIQHGLDLLRETTEAKALETDALRALLSERQSGDFISGADMETKIKAMAAKKRRDKNI